MLIRLVSNPLTILSMVAAEIIYILSLVAGDKSAGSRPVYVGLYKFVQTNCLRKDEIARTKHGFARKMSDVRPLFPPLHVHESKIGTGQISKTFCLEFTEGTKDRSQLTLLPCWASLAPRLVPFRTTVCTQN